MSVHQLGEDRSLSLSLQSYVSDPESRLGAADDILTSVRSFPRPFPLPAS